MFLEADLCRKSQGTEARGPIDTGRRAEPFQPFRSDLGPADKWQDAELGFAGAGSSPSELEERLRNLESFLARKEADGEFEMVRFDWEVFAYGDL